MNLSGNTYGHRPCSDVLHESDNVVEAAAATWRSSNGVEDGGDDLAELVVDNILVDVNVVDVLVVLEGVGKVSDGCLVWDHVGLGLIGEHDCDEADVDKEIVEHIRNLIFN